MAQSKQVVDEVTMKRALTRISYEIIEQKQGTQRSRFSRHQNPRDLFSPSDRQASRTT